MYAGTCARVYLVGLCGMAERQWPWWAKNIRMKRFLQSVWQRTGKGIVFGTSTAASCLCLWLYPLAVCTVHARCEYVVFLYVDVLKCLKCLRACCMPRPINHSSTEMCLLCIQWRLKGFIVSHRIDVQNAL